MAVRLAFLRPRADPVAFGPYTTVSFVRDELIADGETLAKYVEHRWQVAGGEERFSSVEFYARVDVRFEGREGERSKGFGPYSTFTLMDGVAYASGHVFAFFDRERDDWYSSALGNHWMKMAVIVAAPGQEAAAAEDSATD
jgi:hypothetical protein